MKLEKSRFTSEAAPQSNVGQGVIINNDFAAIVPVNSGLIGGRQTNIVSARDLHKALGVGKDFSTWITDRITDYGFAIGSDYIVNKAISPKLGKSPAGAACSPIAVGRPGKDYLLSISTAKEIAMLERNEQGRAVRRYFIQCEEQLQRSVPEIAARPGIANILKPASMRLVVSPLCVKRLNWREWSKVKPHSAITTPMRATCCLALFLVV